MLNVIRIILTLLVNGFLLFCLWKIAKQEQRSFMKPDRTERKIKKQTGPWLRYSIQYGWKVKEDRGMIQTYPFVMGRYDESGENGDCDIFIYEDRKDGKRYCSREHLRVSCVNKIIRVESLSKPGGVIRPLHCVVDGDKRKTDTTVEFENEIMIELAEDIIVHLRKRKIGTRNL